MTKKIMLNLIVTLVCLLLAQLAFAEDRPPNVLFILVDDLGVMDLGIEIPGEDFYETPHVDALAQKGMRFDQGYASSQVCSPCFLQRPQPPSTLFWHYPHYGNQGGEPSSIIRRGHWKLIHYYADQRRASVCRVSRMLLWFHGGNLPAVIQS